MRGFWEWHEQEVSLFIEAAQYIEPSDYEERLKKLGWRIVVNGSHRTAYAPDGVGKVTWTVNNWEKNWHQIARDLLRFALGGRGAGGYLDLEFVWQNPFVIPPNFNFKTQSIDKAPTEDPGESVMVSKLLHDPGSLQGKEVQQGGEWKKVDMADHGTDGISIEVLFDDGTTVKFPMQQSITVRMAA